METQTIKKCIQSQNLINLSDIFKKAQEAKELNQIFSAFKAKINNLQAELHKLESCLSDIQDIIENHIWNQKN